MLHHHLHLAALLGSLAFSGLLQPAPPAPAPAAPATSTPPAPVSLADPRWVKLEDFDFDALLPAPPKPGTPATTGEIELMLAIRAKASPADYDRAKEEKDLTLDDFVDIVGPSLEPKRAKATAALIESVANETDLIVQAAKKHFARPRPSDVDERIPGDHKPSNKSYPSGHAARAWVMARTLCLVLPEFNDQFMQRAREIGWGRVVLGVHFPSDVAAGFTLGEAIFQKIAQHPEFRRRLGPAISDFNADRGR